MSTTAEKAPEATQPATTITATPAITQEVPAPTPTVSGPAPAPAATPAATVPLPTSPEEAEPAAPTPGPTPAPTVEQVPLPQATPAPVAEPKNEAEPAMTEPQNALTQKFTEAEWEALKKFRTLLPDIVKDAYPENEATTIDLWGVNIDPANPAANAKASVVLMKFLRARHLNPNSAREMLTATLRWRASFNIPAALEEQFPEDVFKGLGFIHGVDKQGHPVVYNVYGGSNDIKAAFSDLERFIRWRVALMERSVALLDFETTDQAVQIHDYEGVSITSRTPESKAAASEATSIFSSHYPELLYKKFFINVPFYLTWIFWAFKPLIAAETLAKMSVVGSGSRTIGEALLPTIAAEELPKGYGGKAELDA